MTMGATTRLSWMVLGLLLAVFAGCASTAGSAKTVAGLPANELARYTKVAFVASSAGDAATMSSAHRERIVALVARKLQQRAPARFTDLAAATPDAETLKVTIAFTRYDEGNTFARLMLAGLGQIHIDADVALEDGARAALLARYEVTKTFAWGGIYGATTSILDVEDGFAEA